MRSLPFLLSMALGVAAASSALAQTSPSSPSPDREPSLTEKLNRTDGVIAPPPTGDQEITQQPPNVGTMPVIRPEEVTPPGQTPDQPKPDPK